MRLKYEFEVVDLADDMLAVPVGENSQDVHGILKVNKEGAELLELLQTETSIKEIVDILSEKYENNREDLLEYVEGFAEQLDQLKWLF